jgi:simple sugar transport system ATP-binding protein
LDIAAAEAVSRFLLQERRRGTAILLISEDLDEIFALSDRIIVLSGGRVMGEPLRTETATREQVGLLMMGAGGEAKAV